MELFMTGRNSDGNSMDAPTSRAVARGIGEKLGKVLDDEGRCPDRLQRLMDEMQRRETSESARRTDRQR